MQFRFGTTFFLSGGIFLMIFLENLIRFMRVRLLFLSLVFHFCSLFFYDLVFFFLSWSNDRGFGCPLPPYSPSDISLNTCHCKPKKKHKRNVTVFNRKMIFYIFFCFLYIGFFHITPYIPYYLNTIQRFFSTHLKNDVFLSSPDFFYFFHDLLIFFVIFG